MSRDCLALDPIPYGILTLENLEASLSTALETARRAVAALKVDTTLSDQEFWQRLSFEEHQVGHLAGALSHLASVRNNTQVRNLNEKMSPLLTDFFLELGQDQQIYARLRRLRESAEPLPRATERSLDRRLLEARHSGIELSGVTKARFATLCKRLADLSLQFANNLLDATESYALVLTQAAEVAGMDRDLLEAAAAAARKTTPGATGESGPWQFGLDYATRAKFLRQCPSREARQRYYRAGATLAGQTPFDNRPLLREILHLRDEKAKILGYPDYVALSLAEKMAGDVSQVQALCDTLLAACSDTAQREIDQIRTFARREGLEGELMAWDQPFYSNRLKTELFGYSEGELAQYFPLPQVISGLFTLLQGLFSTEFELMPFDHDQAWNPELLFYQVRENGTPVATLVLDLYVRAGEKNSGAWCRELAPPRRRAQGGLPSALIVCNFAAPSERGPTLLQLGEVETLFHEMGHALQHMLTREEELDVAGLEGIEWDAVEIASQFLENFLNHPDLLGNLSRHVTRNESLPENLTTRVLAARNFQSATQLMRQLVFGLVDLGVHRPELAADPFAHEREIRERYSTFPPASDESLLTSFSHIFAGSYAAGYYSYLWAEVYSADAFAAFEEAGLDDPAARTRLGARFRNTVLARGGGEHPDIVYKAFRGRAANTDALLRHRGIATAPPR